MYNTVVLLLYNDHIILNRPICIHVQRDELKVFVIAFSYHTDFYYI